MVSIIVVSYNTCKMTVDCIRSIFAETSIPFEVIVWDNASKDDSVLELRRIFGETIKLIASDVNIGFAAANNRAAQGASGDRILLLNPDTVVLNQAIEKLMEFANINRERGIWGGKTLTADQKLNPTSCWGRQTLWSLFCQATGLSVAFARTTIFNPEGMGGWRRDGERRVDIVSGCFLLIDTSLWVKLGGFEERYFMYGEEADLCLRASEFGASPSICSYAEIIHYGGASEPVFADKLVRLLKAKRLLIEDHFPESSRRLGVFLLFLWPVRRMLMHFALSMLGRKASRKQYPAWAEVLRRSREWV